MASSRDISTFDGLVDTHLKFGTITENAEKTSFKTEQNPDDVQVKQK